MHETILKSPLVIKRGDTWDITFKWLDEEGNPMDTSGLIACMQFREKVTTPVMIEFSTENGRIVFDGEDIKVHGEAEIMRKLDNSGVFDVQITYPDGRVSTIISGTFTASLDVTRKV